MKRIIFVSVFLAISVTACQKQPDSTDPAELKQDPATIKQFDEADTKIGKFIDQLDSPNTSLEVKKQILCVDYPNVYIQQYAPALLKLSPNDYTPDKLDRDLAIALDYYKDKFNIQCQK
ncbi:MULTISPECIES: hypothetical protein [Acinetobacter]|uniref:hypothetical protein n=1 Tax=Acinetobacter TaxID=469 RepID=UPI000994B00D|nr:hypothetical protein [Acinetobacter sp. MF4642]OOW10286.1 hypothetical protein MF4642_07825 [Acinetobacter sp. MF4642]WQN49532.1 hypothetical protein U6038_09725 [Acinetobacter johnsonii]